jgi:UDPglucose 6-dehydrogenase
LKGAVSYGGPCFPRDNRALASLAARIGASSGLAEATDIFNRAQIETLAALVKSHHSGSDPIGILGLTYKPDTDVVEESFGLLLAQELASANLPVVVFDPSADLSRALAAQKSVRIATSAEDCIVQCGVVVLATPWQEFRELPISAWVQPFRSVPSLRGAPRVVIDCWRALPHLADSPGVQYVRLGFGAVPSPVAAAL